MVYLVYLLALIFIVLGFLFGVSVGWKCVHGRNAGGNLMIAPRRRERTALYFSRPDDIRRISGKLRICGAESETAGDARKTVRLTEETPNLLIKEKIKNGKQNIIERDFGKWD